MSNTAGVLAGVFGTAATGYILQHGKHMFFKGLVLDLFCVKSLATGKEIIPITCYCLLLELSAKGPQSPSKTDQPRNLMLL